VLRPQPLPCWWCRVLGHALETLSRVTDVVFDKTGTLTTGAPSVYAVHSGKALDDDAALALAVALETGSTHPYACALRDKQRESEPVRSASIAKDAYEALQSLDYPASEISHEAGHGVSASLDDGSVLYLGSAKWCAVVPSELDAWQGGDDERARAASEVFLSRRSSANVVEVLARFLINDALRVNAQSLVTHLRNNGMRVHLLSGDRLPAVQSVADDLGITDYCASATPSDKQAFVSRLQEQGSIVLMVGDGINDAPVLASADVSMAAGDATALARTAADVISLLPGLDGLPILLNKAGQTTRIVRQNLAWAGTYNLLAIPLAALGFVPPWAAAIGMALSSLLVAFNAQRLWSRNAELPEVMRAVVDYS